MAHVLAEVSTRIADQRCNHQSRTGFDNLLDRYGIVYQIKLKQKITIHFTSVYHWTIKHQSVCMSFAFSQAAAWHLLELSLPILVQSPVAKRSE